MLAFTVYEKWSMYIFMLRRRFLLCFLMRESLEAMSDVRGAAPLTLGGYIGFRVSNWSCFGANRVNGKPDGNLDMKDYFFLFKWL